MPTLQSKFVNKFAKETYKNQKQKTKQQKQKKYYMIDYMGLFGFTYFFI